MTRAFSYLDQKNQPFIGVEWTADAAAGSVPRYNFTRAWELFKQIKLNGRGPDLSFLQVMVELDLFHAESFDEVFATLQQYRPITDLLITKDFTFQLPVMRPQKILCLGRNYRGHASELNNPVPKEPIFFGKSPSALLPHQGTVHLPRDVGRVDYEAELAVVIGKAGRNVPVAAALEHVAGYTILNDITARELQRQDAAAGLPWFRAKNFDTFCPVGPYLTPRSAITDPQALEIKLKINGEIRQQGTTADMVFPIPEIIHYISRFCTLQPGDLIATGTPQGVGPLQPDDLMVTSILGLGELVNPVA